MILNRKAGRLLVKAYENRGELGRAAAEEAAQALRISQSAVKQRLRRANRRLRDRLKEWYYDA